MKTINSQHRTAINIVTTLMALVVVLLVIFGVDFILEINKQNTQTAQCLEIGGTPSTPLDMINTFNYSGDITCDGIGA